MKKKTARRFQHGFTLMEMLVTIAIIVILVSLVGIAASQILENMRQNKLDTIAQDIYVTAQQRLTEMYTDNRVAEISISDPANPGSGMYLLPVENNDLKPTDWAEDIEYAGLTSLYNQGGAAATAYLLPAGALNAEVEANHWIVEYNPDYGYIYAVYYSEKEFNPADIAQWYETGKANTYRTFSARKGSGVGYYGGVGVLGGKVVMTATSLNVSLNVINAEELNAELSVRIPNELKNRTVRVTMTVTGAISGPDKAVTETFRMDPGVYGYYNRTRKFTLDSFNKAPNGSSQQFKDLYRNLIPGEDVTVRVYAELGQDTAGAFVADTSLDTAESTVVFNSLFAAYDADAKTAYVSSGRHLQNLGTAQSRVGMTVNTVEQIGNIDFKNTTPEVDNDAIFWWGETYPGRVFEPVINTDILTVKGSHEDEKNTVNRYIINGLTVDSETALEKAGLFATLGVAGKTVTVEDISLVGTRISCSGTTVGALAGETFGNVVLKNTGAYLSRDDYNNMTFRTAASRLLGATVGGLIGTVNGNVTASGSYSAQILEGSINVGGLFGVVTGKMAVNSSYADCYLLNDAGVVGGMAGSCGTDSTIEGSYTAGFTIGKPAKSAGFVPGRVASIQNCYTVLNIGPSESGNVSTLFYTTVAQGSTAKNVYYALQSDITYPDTLQSVGTERSYSQLRSGNAGTTTALSSSSFRFGAVPGETTAYNLAAGLGLTNYPYPFIKTADDVLHHFGDWDGNLFDPGTLVYFEQYTTGERGYYGAGSNFLDSSKEIAYDGYALLYTQKNVVEAPFYGTKDPAIVTYGDQPVTIPVIGADNKGHTVNKRSISGEMVQATYYFRDLPDSVINAQAGASENFYTYIRVNTPDTVQDDNKGESYYYFNPHFAATVVQVDTANAAAPSLAGVAKNVIRVRTPRHLYLLSKYYADGHGDALKAGVTVDQEMNLNYGKYSWKNAGLDPVSEQTPIAADRDNRFRATYNGYGKQITGVSFVSDTLYAGMFGYVDSTGRLQNIVVTDEAANGRVVKFRSDPNQNNLYAYIGTLAGYNAGTIQNCAVSGYTINVTSYYTTLYAGGLVGNNNRTIANCAAVTPVFNVTANACNAFAGAFVGQNGGNGFVSASYSISSLKLASYINSNIRAGGFAGSNAGSIQTSYTVAAMTAQNVDAKNVDGFTANGGTVRSCYFLTDGTYKFNNNVYAYGQKSSSAAIAVKGLSNMPGKDGISLSGFGEAVESTSLMHGSTSTAAGNTYPLATSIRNGSGNFMHYGDWISEDVLGEIGLLYWEHEVGGANSGYHFKILDDKGQAISTLCTAHDDGGVVTEYGYGYYKANGIQNNTKPVFGNVNAEDLDRYVNTAASEDLEAQFANAYDFVLYNTTNAFSDEITGMYVTGTNAYATATIGSDVYSFSPFFGATLQKGRSAPTEMEIRSIDQLQFLNWNYGGQKITNVSYEKVQNNPLFKDLYDDIDRNGTCKTYFSKDGGSIAVSRSGNNSAYRSYTITVGGKRTDYNWVGDTAPVPSSVELYTKKTTENTSAGSARQLVNSTNYKNFTYLGYATTIGRGTQTKDYAGNKGVFAWQWNQSHDIKLDSATKVDFTPIAGAATSATSSYTANLYAWFGSAYNGNSYKIQNVAISSDAFTVGLFGVTAGAHMENVIMYSDQDTVIERATTNTDPQGAYALGGLVGVVYDYAGQRGSLRNCAIAGYRIIDNSRNVQGLGEANVGGLTGVCNGNMIGCSAVTDIEINCTHRDTSGGFTRARYGNFIRVGGVTGATLGDITNCYSGGSISVAEATLREVDNNGNYSTTATINQDGPTSIYVSGISGSGFTQNYQNFTNSTGYKDGKPTYTNCYTYMQFPRLEGNIRNISVIASAADRYRHESTVKITNCYYLDSIINKDEMLKNTPSLKGQGGSQTLDRILKNGTLTVDGRKTTYFEEMLAGTSRFTNYFYYNNNTAKIDGAVQLTKLTLAELSNLQINGFAPVTVEENGVNINGKYSFPGSDRELNGRNYPFPAVVTQKSDATGQNVFVHYGAWPKGEGLYSSESSVTLDLLKENEDSIDVDLTFYQNYTQTAIDMAQMPDLTFSEMDETGALQQGLTESANVLVTKTQQEDGRVTLTITGKREGSTTITASYAEMVAEIQVTTTADFSVSATPVLVTFEEDGITVKSVTDVTDPEAMQSVYQGENVFWKLRAVNSADVPMILSAGNWKTEMATIDDNYDNVSFISYNGDVLMQFDSLLAKVHTIQVTAYDIPTISNIGTISGSRTLELQVRVLQDPPIVEVFGYPQDSAENTLVRSLYQINTGSGVVYSADKAGLLMVTEIAIPEPKPGYDTFQGYVLADSLHDVDGTPTYEYFTDENGTITYSAPIVNDIKKLYVYGCWTAQSFNIAYEINASDNTIQVAEGAMTTYTIADPVTLPNLNQTEYLDGDRAKVFTGWKVVNPSEGSNWSADNIYLAGQTQSSGMHGDVTFQAQWASRYNISYYQEDGTTAYEAVPQQFTSYVTNYGDISLYKPEADPDSDQMFIGWKLMNAPEGTVTGWTEDTIYRGTVKQQTAFAGDVQLVAVWGQAYKLTYQVGSETEVKEYPVGYSFNLNDAPQAADGYRFVGWVVEQIAEGASGWTKDTVLAAGAEINNANATYLGDVTLTARFELDQYTITFDANGGTPTPESIAYQYTTQITLPEKPVKEGYDFKGWRANGVGSWRSELYEAGRSLNEQFGNVTLTAEWKPTVYRIYYKLNAGQLTGDGWIYDEDTHQYFTAYEAFGPVTMPQPTKPGYRFDGWTQEKGDVTNTTWGDKTYNANEEIPDMYGNVYMEAIWSLAEYDIVFKNGETTVETLKYTINTTDLTAPSLPQENGYTYSGWNVNAGSIDPGWKDVTLNPGAAFSIEGRTGNVVLTCQKAPTNYSITFTGAFNEDGTAATIEPKNYTIEEGFELPTLPATKYNDGGKAKFFDCWTITSQNGNWDQQTYTAGASISAGRYGDVTMNATYHSGTLTLVSAKANNYSQTYNVKFEYGNTSFGDTFVESYQTLAQRGSWILDGWCSDVNGVNKVLNDDGSFVVNADGSLATDALFNWTDSQNANVTLYAKWRWEYQASKFTPVRTEEELKAAIGANKQFVIATMSNNGQELYVLGANENMNGVQVRNAQDFPKINGDFYGYREEINNNVGGSNRYRWMISSNSKIASVEGWSPEIWTNNRTSECSFMMFNRTVTGRVSAIISEKTEYDASKWEVTKVAGDSEEFTIHYNRNDTNYYLNVTRGGVSLDRNSHNLRIYTVESEGKIYECN